MKKIVSVVLLLCFGCLANYAQKLDSLLITKEKLSKKIVLDKNWKYSLGDNDAWKEKDFDDSSWEKITRQLVQDRVAIPVKKFNGAAWFRLKVTIDTAICNTNLVFLFSTNGAAEVYIDGKLINKLGTPSSEKEKEIINEDDTDLEIPFLFAKQREHIIAIKYSNWKLYLKNIKMKSPAINYGFSLVVKDLTIHEKDEKKWSAKISGIFGLLSGFFIALCFLHLLLFLYYKENKSNVYYSLYSLSLSITFLVYLLGEIFEKFDTDLITDLCFFATHFTIIRFLYSLYYKKPLKIIYLIPVLYAIYFILKFGVETSISLSPFIIMLIFFLIAVESVRIIFQAIWRKKDGAKIIGIGVAVPVITPLLLFLLVAFFAKGNGGQYTLSDSFTAVSVAILCLATVSISISMSIFLARQFGFANKELKKQIVEIKSLSEKTMEQELEKKRILESQKEQLEIQVADRTKELVAEKKAVEYQKELVEEKQREILDSIEYALRIQTAILPPQKIIKQYLQDSFILYKPKDIVAGDFYWMETIDDSILFAACDCTGHGVPGAMVSVVCHNALNRAVREFGLTQPAAILDKTAEIVIENFSKSEEDIKDGMDISLVSIKYNSLSRKIEVEWAGANNPLWIVKKIDTDETGNYPLSIDNYQLLETKADKQPIGMNEDSTPFTNHCFTLNKGDSIYIFSDGFADQFDGETGEKKLTRKRFKELILSVQNKTMTEQGIALDKFIVDYRKNIEQIDDILVMGVKL